MTKTRTRIDVTSAERHDHTDAARDALVTWNDPVHPAIYLRGDVLVRLSRDDDVRLRPYTEPSLCELLGRAAVFERATMRGNTTSIKQVPVPGYIARALLHRTPDDLQGIPKVNRVTDVPVFGADGAIDPHPGYQPSSRTYFAPDRIGALARLPIVGTPESADERDDYAEAVASALRLLLELVGDFPFADGASRAHALSLILEPFVREMIGNEPTPMYLVMAHTPGTGKSLLTRACLGVGCGDVAVETYTNDRDELRKRLTAMLLEGRSAVMFDNVRDPIDSPVLAAALTSPTWADRYLGRSAMVEVPIRNVWTMTANNPNVSREMARRCIPIFLDPGDGPDPLTRSDYKHHNLEQWARANRARLVHAAITLAANWIVGTHEEFTADGFRVSRVAATDFLGSYSAWSRVMGGILKAAGSKEFLGNLGKLHAEADQDTSDAGEFLSDWYERTTEPLRVDDIAALTQGLSSRFPGPPIPLPLDLHDRDLAKGLGYWLRKRKGEVVGGYRVVRHDGRYKMWSVERVG